ncbi:TetR/AcrR family transcriptional regulator [Streptomyces sp. NBC_01304]|uniref:TetR/AcrR family transcriptional regulator n=1 Tax=Streptomyces sp. NBC_01304 TaxID=2903818 RepID=UPI002E1071A1|nr:TetR/AcrR family transcriptional regulator [Streptomyces sp. NBC_01304]
MGREGSDGTGLSPSLEMAWGLRERPSKGPKPGLSLERIVDAAVALAASEGLAAVSMGRVAKELGVSTMSLYRYVGAKDELYILMLEAVTPEPPAPPGDVTGWRDLLAHWARSQRAIFHRNLWVLRIPVSGPPASPRQLAWMEGGLSALAGTGLEEGEKLGLLMLVGGFVRNEATIMSDIDAALTESGATPDQMMGGYARTLAALTDPEGFPAITRVLASGVLQHADEPDAEFDFGLDRLLDGIEVLVNSRR